MNGEYLDIRPVMQNEKTFLIAWTDSQKTYLDGCSLSQTDRVREIRMFASFLCVNLYKPQFFPDALNQIVKASQGSLGQFVRRSTQGSLQSHFTADDHSVVFSSQLVDLFQAYSVNLVVHVCEINMPPAQGHCGSTEGVTHRDKEYICACLQREIRPYAQ